MKKKKPVMTMEDQITEEAEKVASMSESEREAYDKEMNEIVKQAKEMGMRVVSMDDLLAEDQEIKYVTLDNIGSLFMELKRKSRDDKDSKWRSKVFFTAHPLDYEPYFDILSDKILEKFNCNVYYYNEDITENGYKSLDQLLSQMNLFVVPITERFLSENNRAIDFDLSVAQKYGIPVIYILFDADINEFNEKIGNYELIDFNATDADNKFHKNLGLHLLSTDIFKRIEREFAATVFLSYRKKDYAFAKQVIELIHESEFCRDVAVWYDDYLTAGENFDNEIKTALLQCDLFTLVVTPNLLTEGNYVLKNEYPLAVNSNKPILSVEVNETDGTALSDKYPGIPEKISFSDNDAFREALLTQIKQKIEKVSNSPEHKYLIGLAYYYGYRVELKRSVAFPLIIEAAKADYMPAIEFIAMHADGDISEHISDKAILTLLTKGVLTLITQLKTNDFSQLETFWTIANKTVVELISAHLPQSAVPLLDKMLEYAPKRNCSKAESKYTIARLNYRISMAFMIANDKVNALKYSKRAYNEMQNILEADYADEPYALFFNIFGACLMTGQFDGKVEEAQEENALATELYGKIPNKTEDIKIAYAQYLNNYYNYLLDIEEYNKAIDCACKLKVFLNTLRESYLQQDMLATLHSSLGTLFYNGNHIKEALVYLRSAYEIAKKIDCEKSGSYRIVKHGFNYAMVLHNSEIAEEAVKIFADVMEQCLQGSFNSDERYYIYLNSVKASGNSYVDIKDYTNSIEVYSSFIFFAEHEFSEQDTTYDRADAAYHVAYIYGVFLSDTNNEKEWLLKAKAYADLGDSEDESIIEINEMIDEMLADLSNN